MIINYIGPNPYPVGQNCLAKHKFKISEFQFIAPFPCVFDTADIFQVDTIKGLGQVFNLSVQAIDNCNHFTTKAFQIVTADKDGPTITQQPQAVTTAQCSGPNGNQQAFLVWLSTKAGAMAVDNCTQAENITWSTIPANPMLPTDFCTPQDVTVLFVAKDQAGNTTNTTVAAFRIIDTTSPNITSTPHDTSFVCSPAIKANIEQLFNSWMNTLANNTAKANDVCSGVNVSWYVRVDNGPEQKLPIYVFLNSSNCIMKTVSFIAKDNCDNATLVGTAKFSMTDTQVPTLLKPAVNQIHNCNGANGNQLAFNMWLIDHGGARFKDNCTDSTLISYSTIPANPSVPASVCNDSSVVSFIATDICGNSRTSTATFYIKDMTSPVLNNVPADVNFYCTQGNVPPVPNNITGTDNCDANVTIQFQQQNIPGNCGPNSIISRTWTAVDDCGNSMVRTQLISIIDTVPPVLAGNVPNDITVSCENVPVAPPIGTFSATDDCDANVEIIQKDINNIKSCNGTYTIIRLWIANDNCGNADSLKQTITVIDNKAPVLIGVPADVTVNCDNIPAPPIIGVGITATDNCDEPEISYTQTSTIAACNNKKYTITRTWVASDGCGNIDAGTQHIAVTDDVAPVFSGIPPNLTVDCSSIPMPPMFGGSFKATDACDTLVNINFAQINTQNPDSTNCNHYNYTITRVWVANDDCGNISSVSQIIEVKDTLAPTLYCVDTFVLANKLNECRAISSISDLVFFSDGCSNISGSNMSMETLFISHSGIDPKISPVDTLVYNLPIQGVPAFYITGNIVLKLDLNGVDAEAPTEFFRVFAEDGSFLGTTQHTSTQCGNAVTFINNIPQQKINQWAYDGFVSFILVSNANGVDAINDICPGANIKATLSYEYLSSPDVSYNLYYGVDGAPLKQFLPGKLDTFSLGEHHIKIRVEDCSNNFDTCTYVLKVIDNDPPHIICPADITGESLPTDCNANILLPDPIDIGDNCGFNTNATNVSTPTFLFFEDGPLGSKVAKSVSVTFFGQPPIGTGHLRVYIKGDIAQPGEYFLVYDEDNILIDSTGQGTPAKECSEYQAFDIPLSQAQITKWSADNTVKFTIIPNKNTSISTDFINPCGPLDAQNKDNVSMVYFEFVYPVFDVNYVVKDSNNVVIGNGKYIPGGSNTPIPYGKHTITYTIIDGGNNIGACSFKATVYDKTPPDITCKSGTIIDLNPSGLVNTKIRPQDILFSEFDNCGIRNYVVTPSEVSCNLAGTGTTVKVVAYDYSGNKDSCSSIVFFRNEPLTPTVVQDTCGGVIVFYPDTTFTQPTPGTGNFFSYSWVGPNGFFSNMPNPSIVSPGPNYSGSYTLTITGLTGCQSSGALNLSIDQDGLFKPTVYSNSPVCQGDTLVIYTDWNGALSYTWTNVNNSIQLVTSQNYLRIPAQPQYSGPWTVLVGLNVGCNSKPSNPLNVIVNLVGANATDSLEVCKGNKAILNVDAINGSIYKWTGPLGNIFFGKNPEVPAVEGYYKVQVTNTSGCKANDSTYVHINERPQITALSHSCPACVTGTENCSIEPSVFPISSGHYKYEWFNPLGSLFSVDSIAELNNLTANMSGNYVLIVTDELTGCKSTPSQILVSLNNTPLTPIIELDTISSGTSGKICAGEPIILKLLSNPYSGNVKYIWDTPLGKDTTTVPSLLFQNASINNKGFYKLSVLINGCNSNVSNQIFVDVNPVPFPPVPTINSPICEGDSLILSTELVPGATYEWAGPTGIFSNLQSPFIENAKTGDSGDYRVRITVNGCTSFYSAPVNAEVNPIPQAPFFIEQCNGKICADDPSANCLFIAVAPNAPAGSLYNYYFETGAKITGPISSDSLFLSNLIQYGNGFKTFYATVYSKGCESPKSASIGLQLDTIPNQLASAGADLSKCENESIQICASAITTGTGVWTQLNGPNLQIIDPNQNCTQITGYSGGQNFAFIWTLSNGACLNYSADTLAVSVSDLEIAGAVPLVRVCKGEPINLTALSGNGVWKQSDSQKQAGVVIQDTTSTNTLVNGATANKTYYFNWEVDNGACGITASEVIVEVYDDNAFAGIDRDDCGLGCLKELLLANTPIYGSGIWSSPDPGINIETPVLPKSAACGLKNGPNIFIWTTNNGICGENSVDTLVINYQYLSKAVADTVSIPFAGSLFFDVLENDSLSSDYTLIVTQQPQRGSLSDVGNGKFLFSADPDYVGEDHFNYKLCSVFCPEECTETTVVFIIGKEVTCDAPSIITPNGDGVNDAFVVPCLAKLDQFPLNKLSIFNQWGDEVYAATNYQNDWQGTYQGDALPPGTYFYILDLGDGTKPIAGFLIVKK